MNYLLTDSEYTTWEGALESGWAAPGQHREIFQLAALLTDADFHEIDSIVVLVKPKVNPILSEFAQRLTNVSQMQIEQHGVTFPEALKQLELIASRASATICMSGDSGVLRENCRIHGIPFPFEHDFHRLRPFLEQQKIDLSKCSSGELHKLTPTPLEGHTHDALHDCRSMAAWLRHAKVRSVFLSVSDLPTEIPKVDPRSREIVRPT